MRWIALALAAAAVAWLSWSRATVPDRAGARDAPFGSEVAWARGDERDGVARTRRTRPDAIEGRQPVRVRVDRDGWMLLEGEPADLREILAAVRSEPTRPVVIDVDPLLDYARLTYLLGTLRYVDVERVFLRTDGDGMEVALRSSFWTQDASHVWGGHTTALVDLDWERRDRWTVEALVRRRKGIEAIGLQPLGWIEGAEQSFGEVAEVLCRFRDAGIEVELPYFPLREEFHRGPLPESELGAYSDYGCACRPSFVSLRLPAAVMGATDKNCDPDDRVVVQVDAQGRVYWRGVRVNLSELASVLRTQVEKYALKMKAKGRSGYESCPAGTFSKLYVLVRADARAPWKRVAWLLHVLAENRLYKIQFATHRSGTKPSRCLSLEDKLQAFLPTEGPPALVSSPRPWETRVHLYIDAADAGPAGPVYSLERGASKDPRDFSVHLSRLGSARAVVVLHVGRDVTHGQVIAAVDAVQLGAIERIDFDGVSPPPRAFRRAPIDRSDYAERGLMVPAAFPMDNGEDGEQREEEDDVR